MDLTPQQPAEGILSFGDYGGSRLYKVLCQCGSDDHDHDVWVEAEDTGVTVTIYATLKSQFWSLNRWKQIYQLLTKGYLRYETNLMLNEQSALNYAETIKHAIDDVKHFKKRV